MTVSKHTEAQIIAALKQVEAERTLFLNLQFRQGQGWLTESEMCG